MKTFNDLKFEPIIRGGGWLPWDGSKKATMQFDNGYGVQVLLGTNYYSNGKDTYEIAVLKNGKIDYNAPFTGDELDYRLSNEVTDIMIRIQQLNPTTMVRTALMKWQKQLAKLDRTKKVRFDYKVYDCEHDGDMSYAEMECNDFCREYEGEVVFSYWDGEDCGEAYITCEFPADKVEDVLSTEFFDYGFYQL